MIRPAVDAPALLAHAAIVAAALAEISPQHTAPTSPMDPGLLVRAAQLRRDDLILAVAHRPEPEARATLAALLGRPIEICPPRTYALDPVTDRPKTESSAHRPRSRSTRSDPRTLSSVAPNPKKPGSACHARYAHYQVGRTIDECLALGVTRADVRWDLAQGFIVAT